MNRKTIQPLKQLEVFGDILDKPIWGPVFWILFHKQAKNKFTEEWLDQFQESIICQNCKEHFTELRQRFPIKIFKDHEVYAWLIHNMVNTERANKPFFSWEEYERTYK
jgi:hypothetical protein